MRFPAALVLLALPGMAMAARRRELGIRRALGASQSALLAQLSCEITGLALATAAAGWTLGWVLTRAAERRAHLAFRFAPAPALLILAVAVLVDAAACLLPAWRAARRDPAAVLAG